MAQQHPIRHAEKIRRKAVERKHILAAKGGRMDVPFLLLTLMLTGIGLVMLFSASFPSAFYETGGSNPAYYFKRQGIFAALGLFAMFVVGKINYQRWRGAARMLLIFSICLLIPSFLSINPICVYLCFTCTFCKFYCYFILN